MLILTHLAETKPVQYKLKKKQVDSTQHLPLKTNKTPKPPFTYSPILLDYKLVLKLVYYKQVYRP